MLRRIRLLHRAVLGFALVLLTSCSSGADNPSSTAPSDALCRRAVPRLAERSVVRAGTPLQSCQTGACFKATNLGFWRVDTAGADVQKVVLFRGDVETWAVDSFPSTGGSHAFRADMRGLATVFTDVGHLHLKPWDEPPFVLEWDADLLESERVVQASPFAAGYALLIDGPCGASAHSALWRRWTYAVEPGRPLRQIVHEGETHWQVTAAGGGYWIKAAGTDVRVPEAGRPLRIDVRGALVFVDDAARQTMSLYDSSGMIRAVSTAGVLVRATAHGLVTHDPQTRRIERLGVEGDEEVMLQWTEATRLDGTPFKQGEMRVRIDVKPARGGFYLVERLRDGACHLTDQLYRWFGETGELIALTPATSDAIYHPQPLQEDDGWVRAARHTEFIAP